MFQCSEQHIPTRYCVEELGLIEPTEYTLGVDSNGKKDTFQCIPLLEVLTFVCNDQSTVRHIFRPDIPVADGITDLMVMVKSTKKINGSAQVSHVYKFNCTMMSLKLLTR